jgi:LysR family transcriptional regulator, glycine cleavage system transcriptional activator
MERSRLSTLPWTALRTFEAASRLGSFKAAASALAVTPAAISHQVKLLETFLGLRLFERLHRALRLTPAGAVLAREAQRAFAGLEQTIDALMADSLAPAARLTVSVVPSFAAKWLAPRLQRFHAAHPHIDLRIISTEELVDFRHDGAIDVALRYGPGGYGVDADATRLWPSGLIVAVCSAMLAHKAGLRAPADLARVTLIRTGAPGAAAGGAARPGWPDWFAAAGVATGLWARKALRGPLFGTTLLAVEAAAAGQGVALAPIILVADDLAAGRLVRPFEIGCVDINHFWLLSHRDRRQEPRIRAFADWIRREAAESAADPSVQIRAACGLPAPAKKA